MESTTAAALQRLDSGSLSAIFDDAPGRVQQPVVQCVQIKPIAAQNGNPERYRVALSDSKNFCQTMLATSANEEITSGRLKRGCLVQLLGYQANSIKGRKILIVTAIKVLEEYGELDKLGTPAALEVKQEEQQGNSNTISSNNFYGNQQPQQKAVPSPSKPVSSSAHATLRSIEALNPYSNKWTIKARCTSKSDIKTWHNRNGAGKLFSVNLMDESGEIRATGFNDQCDMLYEVFQEGNVYYISSPCRVQMAKKQFSNLNSDYEMTFERDTVVEKAEEQDGVPQVRFNFTTIADLQSIEKDTTIDIVGILKEYGETSQITSKTTSKPYDKRELTLVDDTNYSVRLTIWGKTAASFDVAPDSVIAFKGVKVSDFGGRSLSLLSSGSMMVNPDMDQAHKLKGWYDSSGHSVSYNTHAGVTGTVNAATNSRSDPFKLITEVKEQGLGMSETADWFSVKASIQYIKQDTFCYPACQSEGCNKKVVKLEEEQWRCERCEKSFEKPQYRYIMQVNVSDHTGQLWLSCFDDTGRAIMGMSADELMEIREADEGRASNIFAEATCKIWNWKCKAKMDSFQEQQRVRYQVNQASPLNFAFEAQKLAELIKLYNID